MRLAVLLLQLALADGKLIGAAVVPHGDFAYDPKLVNDTGGSLQLHSACERAILAHLALCQLWLQTSSLAIGEYRHSIYCRSYVIFVYIWSNAPGSKETIA